MRLRLRLDGNSWYIVDTEREIAAVIFRENSGEESAVNKRDGSDCLCGKDIRSKLL
jgi:hypothetical protein